MPSSARLIFNWCHSTVSLCSPQHQNVIRSSAGAVYPNIPAEIPSFPICSAIRTLSCVFFYFARVFVPIVGGFFFFCNKGFVGLKEIGLERGAVRTPWDAVIESRCLDSQSPLLLFFILSLAKKGWYFIDPNEAYFSSNFIEKAAVTHLTFATVDISTLKTESASTQTRRHVPDVTPELTQTSPTRTNKKKERKL